MLVPHLAVIALATHLAYALPPVHIKGSKFFTSEGNQFYVRGVTYARDVADYNGLTNGPQCEIDAKLIGDLGANVINVYSVDPTLNHDKCMAAFEKNGIYVTVNMQTPDYSVNRNKPEWTIDLRNALASVIDGFQGYNNTLALFAANEFVNTQNNSDIAPYAKAIAADMKAYRDLMGYRPIPIGYQAADISSIRLDMQDYLSCGPENSTIDFYALNLYSWCGPATMATSGYDQIYEEAEGYDRPIFLGETGCHNPSGDDERDWADQEAVLGREMNDRYSGAIIYEWVNHENNYGLASYRGGGEPTGTPSLMADYTRLQSRWATLDPTGVKESIYNPAGTKRACPTSTSDGWLVAKNAGLPTLGTQGWTAPTTPASTPNTQAEGAEATSTPTGGGGGKSKSEPTNKSKTPVGAIAGGVLGGLVVLALILVGVLLLLRRKRKQRDANAEIGAVAPTTNEHEKVQQNGFYGPSLNELHAQGTEPTRHELDPARGQIAPMPAAEIEEQRRPQEAGTERVREREGLLANNGGHVVDGGVDTSGTGNAAEPSPFVQRQRDMEMEWLESEEARLRERRALLRRQNGGGGDV